MNNECLVSLFLNVPSINCIYYMEDKIWFNEKLWLNLISEVKYPPGHQKYVIGTPSRKILSW